MPKYTAQFRCPEIKILMALYVTHFDFTICKLRPLNQDIHVFSYYF